MRKLCVTLFLPLWCGCAAPRPQLCVRPPPPDPALMQSPTYQARILSTLCQGPTSADPSCKQVTTPTPK